MEHLLRSHTFAHDAVITAANAGAKRLPLSHLILSDDTAYGLKDCEETCAGHYEGELIVGQECIKIFL